MPAAKGRSIAMWAIWHWLTTRLAEERGQATVEYFLVILAATALAILALNWLNQGSGGSLLGDLFGRVISWVRGRF
jgi:hypothetical protein